MKNKKSKKTSLRSMTRHTARARGKQSTHHCGYCGREIPTARVKLGAREWLCRDWIDCVNARQNPLAKRDALPPDESAEPYILDRSGMP